MTGDARESPATEDAEPTGPAPGAAVSLADNPGGVSIDRLVAELPPGIAELGAPARWEAVSVAANGATVWRLERPAGHRVYLKAAPEAGGAAGQLRGEADRLRWLSALPIDGIALPSVIESATDAETGDHYLALTEVPGIPATRSEALGDAETFVGTLAGALRAVHDVPFRAASFACPVDELLARAGQRVADGLVDRRTFGPLHARYTPEELYRHARDLRPPGPEDTVVVHGDPRLDNTLIGDGAVTGYVDLGRAGVGDRYLDLAILSRELANQVSPHALGPFFAAYGLDQPDLRKLDFYLLLDELL
jgi:aminoglycoside 3'-phosphotransferase II